MQYLSWWRMNIAWDLLAEGKSVSLVADKVGYQSESAFSNTFKKVFGIRAEKVNNGCTDLTHISQVTAIF